MKDPDYRVYCNSYGRWSIVMVSYTADGLPATKDYALHKNFATAHELISALDDMKLAVFMTRFPETQPILSERDFEEEV